MISTWTDSWDRKSTAKAGRRRTTAPNEPPVDSQSAFISFHYLIICLIISKWVFGTFKAEGEREDDEAAAAAAARRVNEMQSQRF